MALSAHRLNSLVAFFFPIATLTAVFGVNLRHGLEEAEPPYPFLILIVAGLILGAILNSFISRSMGSSAGK
jgi:ABC-type polysaccharide/polyol phosphate export permease